MDEIIDTETAKWLLARFPRPAVIFLLVIKVALINPITGMGALVFGLAGFIYVLSLLPLWLGITIFVAVLFLAFCLIVWGMIDASLPKREKKQDENQT